MTKIRKTELGQVLREHRRRMQNEVQSRIRDGRTDRSVDVRDDLEHSDADIQGDLELSLLQTSKPEQAPLVRTNQTDGLSWVTGAGDKPLAANIIRRLEDSDLVIRLLHAGVRHKSARFATPLFHLWHMENDRSRLVENRRRLDELTRSKRSVAELGLNQYQ